jgi:hypothetical protein
MGCYILVALAAVAVLLVILGDPYNGNNNPPPGTGFV